MQDTLSSEQSSKLYNLSFLCAALVVCIHIYPELPLWTPAWFIHTVLKFGLAQVAVPYFFVVSGYFAYRSLRKYSWTGWLGRRARSLLIPYVLFNLLWMVTQCLYSPSTFTWSSMCEILGIYPWGMPKCYPLWFLKELYVFSLLTPLTFGLMKRRAVLGIIPVGSFLLTLALMSLTIISHRTYVVLYCADGIIWYTIGLFLGHFAVERYKVPRWIYVVVSVVSVVGLLGYAVLYPYLGAIPRLLSIKAIIPFMMLSLWWIIPAKALPGWLSGTAFPIYLLHLFALKSTMFVAGGLLGRDYVNHTLTGVFIQWCFALGMSVLLAVVLRRIMPRSAALLFGGR